MESSEKKPRGFAAMNANRQKKIASSGGRAAHEKGTAYTFTSDKAREAGKKGGRITSRNKLHMAEIGRIGGLRSRKNGLQSETEE